MTKKRNLVWPATVVESETLFALAIPRDKKVENTHHRQSKVNSRSYRACRRPYPPQRRRPAYRRPRRRRAHHHCVFGCLHGSLQCDRRQTRGPRSANSRRCSRRLGAALPRRSAHLGRIVERLAGEVRRDQRRAVQDALADWNGLVRWEMFCPAGRSCLRQDVSMRSCSCFRAGN